MAENIKIGDEKALQKTVRLDKKITQKTGKRSNQILAKEILVMFFFSMAASIFLFFFLRSMAGTLVWNYCEMNQIVLTEMQEMDTDFLIEGGSLIAAVLIFIGLFLALLGRKLSYLQVILDGIEALRIHRMDYSIPLEGENEFTELAKSINELSRTERELTEKEKMMQREREMLIRALSHDIRTPLTSIRSYSEIMASRAELGEISQDEMQDYIHLMQRKADQIKELTDQLLENSKHNPEWIEDGRLLMEQLICEWEEILEDKFDCRIHLEECPTFSGEIDVKEFQRIFDNLYSNILKYADEAMPVELKVGVDEGRLCLWQKNGKRREASHVESHQIGMLSMKAIAGNYGGEVVVTEAEETFEIRITFILL